MKTIIFKRAKAPTPKFFRMLRTIGLSLATAGAAIIAVPIALPAMLTTIAGYLLVAGSVASAVSQLTIEEDKIVSKTDEHVVK